MSSVLYHRGPDDSGVWVDAGAGIALGHRRLSVIDLSPAGHQPMVSHSQRYVIAFNGEIYNHFDLRRQLDAAGIDAAWRGHSDTEVLLAAVERWGIKFALQKCVGMFAFALWDRQERVLTLARDRLGEKPLYYGWQSGSLVFASELKSIRANPDFVSDIDPDVLATYFQRGYVPAPYSIFRGINKLLPGTYVQVAAAATAKDELKVEYYWSLSDVAAKAIDNRFDGDETAALDELDTLLRSAVAAQCVADVPLGAFLSGGIDSTTVVALMQNQASQPVRTFTIGFQESDYDEAEHARKVAQYLGTDHTELYVTPAEAMEVIPQLPTMFDEPFGDSSAIPTAIVSRLARQDVTVSLSGDGGDELFAGYTRYVRAQRSWQTARRIPRVARQFIRPCLATVSRAIPARQLGGRIDRLSRYLGACSLQESFYLHTLQRHDTAELVPASGTQLPMGCIPECLLASDTGLDGMLYSDSMSYLPDDILTKVDRAAMACSLETRVPLLDHRVVEFAWRLPVNMKVRDGESKWLLKRLLDRYVPAQLMNRPKAGFGVPVSDWIRGPLREWSEDLLSRERLERDGFLNPQLVREGWRRHLDNPATGDESHWQVLAFQAWYASVTER